MHVISWLVVQYISVR